MDYLKLYALFIYLAVDVLYIMYSKEYYNGVVKKIQGEEIAMSSTKLMLSIVSYAILGAGWLVFVIDPATPDMHYTGILWRAVFYALSVYGIFNATLYVMFKGWDASVALRDFLWGLGWISLSSVGYLAYLKKMK